MKIDSKCKRMWLILDIWYQIYCGGDDFGIKISLISGGQYEFLREISLISGGQYEFLREISLINDKG